MGQIFRIWTDCYGIEALTNDAKPYKSFPKTWDHDFEILFVENFANHIGNPMKIGFYHSRRVGNTFVVHKTLFKHVLQSFYDTKRHLFGHNSDFSKLAL